MLKMLYDKRSLTIISMCKIPFFNPYCGVAINSKMKPNEIKLRNGVEKSKYSWSRIPNDKL